MSLLTAIDSSLAGLNAQSTALSNISNNVANSSTVGYKEADTQFESMVLASSASGSGSSGTGWLPGPYRDGHQQGRADSDHRCGHRRRRERRRLPRGERQGQQQSGQLSADASRIVPAGRRRQPGQHRRLLSAGIATHPGWRAGRWCRQHTERPLDGEHRQSVRAGHTHHADDVHRQSAECEYSLLCGTSGALDLHSGILRPAWRDAVAAILVHANGAGHRGKPAEQHLDDERLRLRFGDAHHSGRHRNAGVSSPLVRTPACCNR